MNIIRDRYSEIFDRESFDFELLIGALRYYEYRMSIASASFPGNVVRCYWVVAERTDKHIQFCKRVANQFVHTDHKSEYDWAQSEFECDREPWTRFYNFCKGYVDGYYKVHCKLKSGEIIDKTAFKVEYENHYYPLDKYLENPDFPQFISPDSIVNVELMEPKPF